MLLLHIAAVAFNVLLLCGDGSNARPIFSASSDKILINRMKRSEQSSVLLELDSNMVLNGESHSPLETLRKKRSEEAYRPPISPTGLDRKKRSEEEEVYGPPQGLDRKKRSEEEEVYGPPTGLDRKKRSEKEEVYAPPNGLDRKKRSEEEEVYGPPNGLDRKKRSEKEEV
uniref:Uncharacterized protein n=2 Tax=Ciona intestinalis TaxID=7719 RepID=H2XJL9_CIOIN